MKRANRVHILLKSGAERVIPATYVNQYYDGNGEITRIVLYRAPKEGEEGEMCAGFRASEIIGWFDEYTEGKE